MYLCNAFSLQMLDSFPASVMVQEVTELPEGLTSAIGHQDTANVLGVPMNRVNVRLSKGDTVYVAQLLGGRLPEGSTTLPEGFSFKFLKIDIQQSVLRNKPPTDLYELVRVNDLGLEEIHHSGSLEECEKLKRMLEVNREEDDE